MQSWRKRRIEEERRTPKREHEQERKREAEKDTHRYRGKEQQQQQQHPHGLAPGVGCGGCPGGMAKP